MKLSHPAHLQQPSASHVSASRSAVRGSAGWGSAGRAPLLVKPGCSLTPTAHPQLPPKCDAPKGTASPGLQWEEGCSGGSGGCQVGGERGEAVRSASPSSRPPLPGVEIRGREGGERCTDGFGVGARDLKSRVADVSSVLMHTHSVHSPCAHRCATALGLQ